MRLLESRRNFSAKQFVVSGSIVHDNLPIYLNVKPQAFYSHQVSQTIQLESWLNWNNAPNTWDKSETVAKLLYNYNGIGPCAYHKTHIKFHTKSITGKKKVKWQ